MASVKTALAVGLFVAVGFVVFTVGIIWLGMSNYFEKGTHYIAYFDESVQGLDKDSPVKYRGVAIGRVEKIRVAPDMRLIETQLKIETDLKPGKDVVAQLKSVGITGIMFIELEHEEPEAPDLSPALTFTPPYPVIKTRPSEIKQLIEGIGDVFDQIKLLDVKGISTRLKETIDILNQTARDARIGDLSADISSTLEKMETVGESINRLALDARKTVTRFDQTLGAVDTVVRRNKDTINKTVDEFHRSLTAAGALLSKGTNLIDQTDNTVSILRQHLQVSLNNIEQATENLNRLINILADQPSQLIFGQPPPPRKTQSRE